MNCPKICPIIIVLKSLDYYLVPFGRIFIQIKSTKNHLVFCQLVPGRTQFIAVVNLLKSKYHVETFNNNNRVVTIILERKLRRFENF